MTITSDSQLRELDRRQGDGIDLRLLWHPETNGVSIAIRDEHADRSLAFVVAPTDALDAFRQPLRTRATASLDARYRKGPPPMDPFIYRLGLMCCQLLFKAAREPRRTPRQKVRQGSTGSPRPLRA